MLGVYDDDDSFGSVLNFVSYIWNKAHNGLIREQSAIGKVDK
jgi:hypothetical protein